MSNRGSQASRALAARNGEKVLVVDDDARVLDLLQITLSGRGFNVVTAVNGEEALRRIEGARPDLMVIDTHLPRRSGLDVLALIREQTDGARLPVILISSNATSEAKLEGFRRGADDYVAKPFSPRELILRIRRILDRVEETEGLERRVDELESQVSRGERALEESRAGLRSRLFRVGSIIHALQKMSSSQNIDDLVSRFATISVGYLDLDAAGLFLEDRGRQRFVCRVARGLGHHDQRRLTFSHGLHLSNTLRDIEGPLSLASLEAMPESAMEVAPLRAAGIAYMYPIVVDGRLLGAIGVGVAGGPREAGNGELLQAVANAIGGALTHQGAIDTLQRTFLETSSLLIESLEARHTGMQGHSRRVAAASVKLAEGVDFSASEIETVRLGALLHDLGLIELYERLDTDSLVLDPTDRAHLVGAPAKAADQIAEAGGPLADVAAIVRHHHEHWDGSGYPERLGGTSIPKGARVVAIANAFDALTSERSHRPAFTFDVALDMLEKEAGREFDPDYTAAFVSLARGGKLQAA